MSPRSAVLLLTGALLGACATAPSGRHQLLLLSGGEMNQMGVAAFDKLKHTDRLAHNPGLQQRAQCVVAALVAQLPPRQARMSWEVQLFQDDNPNAFALPGGKIGVNTGLFAVARSPAQLAAVLGHEIGHVVSEHANERVSQQVAAGIGLQAIGAYSGSRTSPDTTKALLSALGLGAQLGVLLPYSRLHESEADHYGQQLMARAGFDPAAAVSLWQAMQGASRGGRPPQALSSHPNPEARIRALQKALPARTAEYAQARAAGRQPNCG